MEIENSLLRPCAHDERYDYESYEDWLYADEDEEEESEREFEIGDIVTDGKMRYAITGIVYEDREGWLYECEPLEDSEYQLVELYEHELSAI